MRIDAVAQLVNMTPRQRADAVKRVRERANLADGAEPTGTAPLPAADSPAPASFLQEQLMFLDMLSPGTPAYHIPFRFRLTGPLDVPALRGTLAALADRHRVLRAALGSRGGRFVQRDRGQGGAALPVVDLTGLDPGLREAELDALSHEAAHSPFDLANGPLLRTRLCRVDDDEHVLLLIAHHAIADGHTVRVLVEEMSRIYPALRNGRPIDLPPPANQYADWAQWQRSDLTGAKLEGLLAFWRGQVDGAPDLRPPFDAEPSPTPRFEGAMSRFEVPPGLTAGIGAVARDAGVTPFTVLLAAYQIVLAAWTGQRDLTVGTSVPGRDDRRTADLVGPLLNVLPIRCAVPEDGAFAEHLSGLRRTCLDAMRHQELPFGQLVRHLAPDRPRGRNPLFQTMFDYGGAAVVGERTRLDEDLELAPEPIGLHASQMDIAIVIEPVGDRLAGRVEYRTDLFKAASVRRFQRAYLSVLSALADRPGMSMAEAADATGLTGPAPAEVAAPAPADFWRTYLDGTSPLSLPSELPHAEAGGEPKRLSVPVPPDLFADADRFAAANGIDAAPVLLAAFWTVLHRYTAQDDIAVRGPVDGVDRPAVLRADLGDDPAFATLVGRAAAVSAAIGEHAAAMPPDDAVPEAAIGFDPLGGAVPEDGERPGPQWSVDRPGCCVHIAYDAARHRASTLAAMTGHFAELVRNLTASPDRPVSEVPMLPEAERAELIHRWQGPSRPVAETGLAERFAERVAAAPDATAIVVEGRATTYAELNRRANRFANTLAREGVGRGDRVACCLPRGVDQVAAVIGILKIGGVFVPLDPAHPSDRLADLLTDCRARAVITADDRFGDRVDPAAALPLDLQRHAELLDRADDADPPRAAAAGRDPAYALYTSGSTGMPKGVLVSHRSVRNFIDAVTEMFALTERDRILGYAACTYDVSIFEMFAALLNGAGLYLAVEAERLNTRRLAKLIESEGITITDLPPTVMSMLDPGPFRELRVAFVGGEPFSGELVRRWNDGRRFVNGYGVTEGTVTQIAQDCPGDWQRTPPIGRPMANQAAYVVDRHLEPVPYDVAGELLIAGEGVALEYLNRPELTEHAFRPNHLDGDAYPRLYRTGDLVRRRRDGSLVYLGRIDRQLKIRGIRIEPSEVEVAIEQFPSVRKALVDKWVDSGGAGRLVAYLCPAEGDAVDLAELREHLAGRLPSALIPAFAVAMPQLPLTSSGKIDHRKLPEPGPRDRLGSDA
ncbi:MAG TPA: amino acid adenylation domain-containing protein [Glycomyces sp.]|nr:amino acid adenylation domain-containing protein [Glycomyces sp.]